MTAAPEAFSAALSPDYGDCQPIAVIAAACRFPRSETVEARL